LPHDLDFALRLDFNASALFRRGLRRIFMEISGWFSSGGSDREARVFAIF
jgi:hypothetical protein